MVIPFYYEFLAPNDRIYGFVSGCGVGAAAGRLLPVLLAFPFFLDDEAGTWRFYLVSLATPGIILITLALLFLEESPRFLLNKGKHDETRDLLQRMANKNGRKIPEDLELIPDYESGDSQLEKTFWEKTKNVFRDRRMLHAFLCILAMASVSRFLSNSQVFVKTEILFKEGEVDKYCTGTTSNDYLLQKDDYLLLLYYQLSDLVIITGLYLVLKFDISSQISNMVAFGISFASTALLVICPKLNVALFLNIVLMVSVAIPSFKYFIDLSAMLPTKIRNSLFGITNFISYLLLPFAPFVTQYLSKISQDWVTGVTLAFTVIGFVAAFLTPRKIYQN